MKSFSAIWSNNLQAALAQAAFANGPYHMRLTGHAAAVIKLVINKNPIEIPLESCYVPSRGDEYRVKGNSLHCEVSPESLIVLVRRLLEADDEIAYQLASDICYSLNIELV